MTKKEGAVHPALARRGEGVCADGLFEMPTRVLFERGVASQVGDVARALDGRRAMLVTDPGVLALGIAGKVVSASRVLESRSRCSIGSSPTRAMFTAWRLST